MKHKSLYNAVSKYATVNSGTKETPEGLLTSYWAEKGNYTISWCVDSLNESENVTSPYVKYNSGTEDFDEYYFSLTFHDTIKSAIKDFIRN